MRSLVVILLIIQRIAGLRMALDRSLITYVNSCRIQIPSSLIDSSPGHYIITIDKKYNYDVLIKEDSTIIITSNVNVQQNDKIKNLPLNSLISEMRKTPTFPRKPTDEIVDWMATDGLTSLARLPRPIVHQYNILHRGIGVIVLDPEGRIFVHQRSAHKRVFPAMYDMFVGGVSEAGEPSYITLLRELQEEVGLNFTKAYGVSELQHLSSSSTPPASPSSSSYLDHDDTKTSEEGDTTVTLTNKTSSNKIIQKARQHIISTDNTNNLPTANCINYLGRITVHTSYNHCIVECYAAICSQSTSQQVKFNDGEVQWGEWMTGDELDRFLAVKECEFVPDGLQVWNALAGL